MSEIKQTFGRRSKMIHNRAKESRTRIMNNTSFDTMGRSLTKTLDVRFPVLSKPVLIANGGQVIYNFNYRANTDTPYAEQNIYQHMVNASFDFRLMNLLPFTASVWVRKSNSAFYKDITDVQLNFNASVIKQQLFSTYKQRLAALTNSLYDSTLEKKYSDLKDELLRLDGLFKASLDYQKLIQANETLKVPEKNWDVLLSDSANKHKTDSLQREAKKFIDFYNNTKAKYDSLSFMADSLAVAYAKMKSKINRYQDILKKDYSINQLESVEQHLNELGLSTEMPRSFKWLTAIRNFSLGRAPVNYSELTAKNVSLNGINFEYNSRIYLAFAAGTIDYRFNDVLIRRNRRAPQFFSMLRLGIGKIEKSNFIVSIYRGQKQIYFSGTADAGTKSIPVFGYSAEGRWKINRNTYVTVEIAESLSPNLRFVPEQKAGGAFNLTEKDNKAYAGKVTSRIPSMGTSMEAMYKYTGANFQSFSSFQTNAALSTWYIQAEQNLLRRRLKINASLRSNDFSNPYIVQNYKSNTIFKSFAATLRFRKFPMISVGYIPMSQLTMMDNVVVENRFQTFTATSSHYYKIGTSKASSFASVHRFINSSIDSNFVFFNATNILVGQSFYFDDFTASINLSRSASMQYVLNVASEEVSFPISKKGNVGLGIKLNHYNLSTLKIGQFANMNYQIGSLGFISISYERGYLPGSYGKELRLSSFGNVQFIRKFK